jgi:dCTP deaminase
MTFWSGEKLKEELPELINPYNQNAIDCASYQLSLGDEAFVTKDLSLQPSNESFVQDLTQSTNSKVIINPGQFAFLLTQESIIVPKNAIALISIRAKMKFKGLINVSGFHVDPGWSGKLIFGVYNAGPQPIVLDKGHPLFLIVYASLDRNSDKFYDGNGKNRKGIDSSLIQNMTGQVFSPMMLERKITEHTSEVNKLRDEISSLKTLIDTYRNMLGTWKTIAWAIISAIISATTLIFYATNSDFGKSVIGRWITHAIFLSVEDGKKGYLSINKYDEKNPIDTISKQTEIQTGNKVEPNVPVQDHKK